MTRLPVIPGRMLVRVLERRGFVFVRQRGSHMILRRASPPYTTLSIPDHKEIRAGTLRGILRDVEMSVEELNEALGQL